MLLGERFEGSTCQHFAALWLESSANGSTLTGAWQLPEELMPRSFCTAKNSRMRIFTSHEVA